VIINNNKELLNSINKLLIKVVVNSLIYLAREGK